LRGFGALAENLSNTSFITALGSVKRRLFILST